MGSRISSSGFAELNRIRGLDHLPYLSVTALLCCLAIGLCGCVIIPSRPKSITVHSEPGGTDPQHTWMSSEPRQLINILARATLREDRRLQRVDSKTFMAASAHEGLSLAQLLEPSMRPLLEPLKVDYVVVFEEPKKDFLSSKGGGVVWLGYYGLFTGRESTTYRAAVIDLRNSLWMNSLTSNAVGDNSGVGLFFGFEIDSDTNGHARKALIRKIVETFAEGSPTGKLRIVFLGGTGI